MDPDSFLRAVGQPPPSPEQPVPASAAAPKPAVDTAHIGKASAPVFSAPSPAPIQGSVHAAPSPAQLSPQISVSIKHPLHWSKRAMLVAAVLVVVVGAGSYYWYVHRAYTQSEILALVRAQVLPSIVQVRCAGQEGGAETQGGTGTYYREDGAPMVATNAHVVLGDDGQYHGCNVYFPNPQDGSFYQSAYAAGDPVLYHDLKSYVNNEEIDGIDYALLPLTGPAASSTYPFPPAQKDAYAILERLCKESGKAVPIGQGVYLLGYPDIGGDSLTFTEGVVSGFIGDQDEFIKVSASTSHGNSGGIAISASGCFLGIPSQASFQAGGNLSYILSSGFIQQFMQGQTGEKTYEPPTGKYRTLTYSFPDFSIEYPADWSVATSTTGDGVYLTSFSSPSQSAVDQLDEALVVAYQPGGTAADRTQAIQQLDQNAVSVDPNARAGTRSVQGRKAYQEYFRDATLQTYAVPALVNRFILPLLPNGLYVISTTVEDGPKADAFTNLLADMLGSVQYR